MKRIAVALLMLCMPVLAPAAGGGAHLDHVDLDLQDKASLQRGARVFVNYCLSCHSASYMRYNRMARDLDISEALLKDNLMFATEKVGELMHVAMSADDAKHWFGTAPPDLSVASRSRGADWLYTYMRSFYLDDSPSRPFGVNNTLFKDVAMPHVLWELQGWQRPVYGTAKSADGAEIEVIESLELVRAGSMTPDEYDATVRDLVNFMVYMGEPALTERRSLGVWVLMFLGVFLVVAYLLKKEYWKDVH